MSNPNNNMLNISNLHTNNMEDINEDDITLSLSNNKNNINLLATIMEVDSNLNSKNNTLHQQIQDNIVKPLELERNLIEERKKRKMDKLVEQEKRNSVENIVSRDIYISGEIYNIHNDIDDSSDSSNEEDFKHEEDVTRHNSNIN